MEDWQNSNPQAAWQWHSENGTPLPENLISNWARSDLDNLIQNLDTFQNEGDRLQAIDAISTSLARRGTGQALDWVDSLPSSSERDAGFQAVYEATPKGIGAMLSMENGFPKIQELVPGGALEGSGIQPGDLIVESREAGGEANNLYGTPLRETVGYLRGAPGSTVEIRVLRENAATGNLEEHTVAIERDLLILDRHDEPDSPKN